MKPVDLTLTVEQPLPGAQTKILSSVDARLRAVGYAQHPKARAVDYRPRFVGLVWVWLIRQLQGDHVTFTFEPQGAATEVRVTGRLRDRAHAELTEVLNGH